MENGNRSVHKEETQSHSFNLQVQMNTKEFLFIILHVRMNTKEFLSIYLRVQMKTKPLLPARFLVFIYY